MDINIIKTIQWSDSEETILALAEKCLGKPKNGKPRDFVEFISAYPAVDYKRMVAFVEKVVQRHTLADITSMAAISEDSCLFSFSSDSPTALEIILSSLRVLNTGGVLPSLWCFLDCDMKAVVHFVNKTGWCAEAFFLCNEDFSVLHLINDGKDTHFVPVIFTTDISRLAAKASQNEDSYLRQYLPRDLYSFLSNKSGKKKISTSQEKSKTVVHDKGDLL